MRASTIGQLLTVGPVVNLILHWQIFHVSMHDLPCDEYLEFTMTAYIPALIWVLAGVICLSIAKRRHVKQTAIRAMLVALLGPIAIPWVLVAKPEKFHLA
jgi:hypothetical protein